MENRFQGLIDSGYTFDMGKILGKGWDIFKEGAGSFIGFTLVYFILSIGISFALTIMLFFIPGANILGQFINYALLAGIYVFCRNLLNKRDQFGDFFEGFKSFGQIALFLIVITLFMIPVFGLIFAYIFPWELFAQALTGDVDPYIVEEWSYSLLDNLGNFFLIWLVAMAIYAYIAISYSFTLPLIVDQKFGFWEAMETSRKVIAKRFFNFLGMWIILGILAPIAIVITCGLGIFVVFPYFRTVNFAAYDMIMQPTADTMQSDVEEFGQQDQDINTESEDDSEQP